MSATTRRTRRIGAGFAVAAVLLVAGIGLVRNRSTGAERRDSADGSVTAAGSAQSDRPTVADEIGGSAPGPRGEQDEDGAVAAALAYTAAPQRWLYLEDDDVAAEVEAIAAPHAADGLTEDVLADVRAARDELARSTGRVWWFVHPLATRVESFVRTEATVSVWLVTVLAADEVAAPQAEWTTVTVDMEWSGAWRVMAIRDRSGPTPMTGPRDDPWDAQPFDDALDGFARLGPRAASHNPDDERPGT